MVKQQERKKHLHLGSSEARQRTLNDHDCFYGVENLSVFQQKTFKYQKKLILIKSCTKNSHYIQLFFLEQVRNMTRISDNDYNTDLVNTVWYLDANLDEEPTMGKWLTRQGSKI